MSPEHLTKCFSYLDNLRDSGITNMWGASSYLARAMRLESREASSVLGKWMKTFDVGKPAAVRAKEALNA